MQNAFKTKGRKRKKSKSKQKKKKNLNKNKVSKCVNESLEEIRETSEEKRKQSKRQLILVRNIKKIKNYTMENGTRLKDPHSLHHDHAQIDVFHLFSEFIS